MTRLFTIGLGLSLLVGSAARAEPFVFNPGDRVVFIGNTFVERAQYNGYLETALTLAHPKKGLTFRNLGWSGDNVYGESRAFFGKPRDGYNHLMKHVDICKPTVIVVNYGANAAFQGEAGLASFLEQYRTMLHDLKKRTPRLVILAPAAVETLGPPLPDMALQNKNLKHYTEAIARLAEEEKCHFLNLFEISKQVLDATEEPLTDNGIHFTDEGYKALATPFAEALTGSAPDAPARFHQRVREVVLKKDELFFHRHRPQNETYLRGVRKHEQGRNAVEITQFDELVEQQDRLIALLLAEMTGGK
ncbi:MAG: SGNH/GDSL hydrolase family protein [Verrucomicrobiota bacterium]